MSAQASSVKASMGPLSVESGASVPAVQKEVKVDMNQTLLVMDVVDELRHNENYMDQKISEATSDEELRVHIQKVYTQNGITVSEELIGQAVEAYRSRQFRFTPAPKGMGRTLGMIYVTRSKWMPKAAATCAVLAALVSAGKVGQYYMVTKPQQEAFAAVKLELSTAEQSLRTKHMSLVATQKFLEEQVKSYRLQALSGEWTRTVAENRMTQSAQILQETGAQLSQFRLPEYAVPYSAQEAKNNMSALDGTQSALNAISAKLEEVRANDTWARGLTAKEKELRALRASSSLPASVAKKAALSEQKARTALMSGDLGQASVYVSEVSGLYGASAEVEVLQKELAQQKLMAKSLDATATEVLTPMWARIDAAIESVRIEDAKRQMNEARGLMDYASNAVVFTIVSRQGVKSGIERSFEGNRGTAKHYVIVEALDASGSAMEVPFTNVEDGKVYRKSMFGMGVSPAVFEDVKRDKKDDGIIQNNVVGKKAAGSLRVDSKMGFTGNYLARW